MGCYFIYSWIDLIELMLARPFVSVLAEQKMALRRPFSIRLTFYSMNQCSMGTRPPG